MVSENQGNPIRPLITGYPKKHFTGGAYFKTWLILKSECDEIYFHMFVGGMGSFFNTFIFQVFISRKNQKEEITEL